MPYCLPLQLLNTKLTDYKYSLFTSLPTYPTLQEVGELEDLKEGVYELLYHLNKTLNQVT